jgi:putative ABC transport system permease protein
MRRGRALARCVRALSAHRARTALIVSSMAVGVCGVLLTSAIGKGAERELRRGIEAAGGNLLVVRPAQVKRLASRRKVIGAVTTLRLEDAEAIAALPLVVEEAPGIDGGVRLRAGGGAVPAGLLASGPSLARLRGFRLRSGRFFDADDDRGARRVAVLGSRLAATLFAGEDGVGRELRLRGLPFEVVGVLEPIGLQRDGADQDGTVFVPIRTGLRRVFNANRLTTVFVSVGDRRRMREAESAIRSLLRERHRLSPAAADDFDVQDQARLLALQRDAVGSLTLLSSGLAAVAMVVAGAGILALMLLSVRERTAEIGLRLAVGARPRDVLLQILGEAAVLALGGWAAGATLAAAGATAVAAWTDWSVALPGAAAAGSLVLALVSGLGGGALPARRAARLVPIEALRAAS